MFTEKLYLVSYDLKTKYLVRDTCESNNGPHKNQYTIHWQKKQLNNKILG